MASCRKGSSIIVFSPVCYREITKKSIFVPRYYNTHTVRAELLLVIEKNVAMKTLKLILLVLLVFQHCPAIGNPLDYFHFEHITIKDGLSQNYITSIHEDAKGFIWIGTKNGLNKYDGYKVTEYSHSPNSENSLCSNYIEIIYKDSKGQLWIGTDNGLSRYRPDTDDFDSIDFSASPNNSIENRHILSLYEDNGLLWIGTGGGMLCSLKLEENALTYYPPKIDKTVIKDIIRYKGRLLIGCANHGLFYLDVKRKTLSKVLPETSLGQLTINSFCTDKQGNLWIGTRNKGVIKHGESKNMLTDKAILDLCAYQDSIILVGTEGNGLACHNRYNGLTQKMGTNHSNINLNSDVITCFYVDSSGTLWMGTSNGGVNKYDPHKNNFHYLSLLSDNNPGTVMHSVYTMMPLDRDALLVGLDAKGAYISHRESGQIEKIYTPFLNETSVNTLLKDSRNIVWMGTYMKSLKLVGPTGITSRIETLIAKHLSQTASVKTICEDYKHRIWIGTSDEGILCYNPATHTVKTYGDALDVYMHPNVIVNIYEDDEHQLWVGTSGGLFRYSESKDDFEFSFFPNKKTPLSPENMIVPICKVKNMLWLGTRQGLIRFDYKSKQSTVFNRSHGLPSENIRGILHDPSANDLWISTDKGLSRMNLTSMKFTNFGLKDGIVGCEFNDMSFLKREDGYFYFGSVDGICYFHPALIRSNPYPPKVSITNYRLYNHQLDDEKLEGMSIIPVTEKQVIEIPYDESIFSVDYVALSYTNSNKNQYAYKLEGYDNEWKYVNDQRMATYTNLSPGSYTFRVIAANNDGEWNKEGSSLNIVILPPWWRTPWAYLVYIILVGGAIIMSIRFYMARLKMKSQLAIEQFERAQLEKLDQMKTQFFSNITHELRTPLTLILSPVERLIHNKVTMGSQQEYLKIIQNNAVKLLGLVNQLLDFSKTDAGNFHFKPEIVDVFALIKAKIESFLPLAEQQKLDLCFIGSEKEMTCIADSGIIDKIVYNLLSNAVKYTPENGKIEVKLTTEQQTMPPNLILTVRDTGKGIPANKQELIFDRFYQLEEDVANGTGIGLSLVKSLAELHGGKIEVESEIGKGSTFKVSLPFVAADEPTTATMLLPHPKITNSEHATEAIKKPRINLYHSETDAEDIHSPKRDKIVIVEDNIDLRHFIVSILSDRYIVLEADNGLIATELIHKEMPDLILSDVLMPEMDGKQLCQQLKQDIQTCHIPFIMLTALTSDASQIEGLTAGADDYITKPFNSDILLSKIKNALFNRSLMYRRIATLSALEPDEVVLEDKDSAFLLQVIKFIKSDLSNPDLKVDDISKELGMSRTPFFKKLKALTGLTPNDFIRDIRLNQAAKLLIESDMPISEVAYNVGFASPKYFRECFKKQFGDNPTEYIEKRRR